MALRKSMMKKAEMPPCSGGILPFYVKVGG